MIFKYSDYKEFLKYCQSISKIVRLEDFDGSNCIILRHDVDIDVEAAYNLALLEKEVNVRSTFLFLTTSHTYNIFSSYNRKLIKEMSDMGFEIGLHFDPTVYHENLDYYVRKEAEILSLITGKEVKSVSIHNPSVHNIYPIFDGFVNSYDPKIFNDDCYISDSCMDFRGKNIFDFVKKSKEKPIQILLHPFHFSEEGYVDYLSLFSKVIKRNIKTISSILQSNTKFANDIGELKIEVCNQSCIS